MVHNKWVFKKTIMTYKIFIWDFFMNSIFHHFKNISNLFLIINIFVILKMLEKLEKRTNITK